MGIVVALAIVVDCMEEERIVVVVAKLVAC